MDSMQHTIDRYFDVWNTTHEDQRRTLIAEAWSTAGTYVDPLLEGNGQPGIDAMIAAVQAQFPGHTLRQVGPLDSHHDRVRFAWEMIGPEHGTVVLRGIDFGIVAPDGRLESITGFLDNVPANGGAATDQESPT
jgi:hypothetical protein